MTRHVWASLLLVWCLGCPTYRKGRPANDPSVVVRIALAEQFMRDNGYTDYPGDESKVVYDYTDPGGRVLNIEDESKWKRRLLDWRHGSTESQAFALTWIRHSAEYDAAVVFRPCADARSTTSPNCAPAVLFKGLEIVGGRTATSDGNVGRVCLDAALADVIIREGDPHGDGDCARR